MKLGYLSFAFGDVALVLVAVYAVLALGLLGRFLGLVLAFYAFPFLGFVRAVLSAGKVVYSRDVVPHGKYGISVPWAVRA